MPETNFFWDPLSDNILQERDETGAVTAEYTTEPGLYGNLISQNRVGVESQYHFDALGSTLALTDDNQQVTDTYAYSAFGEVTEQTGSTVNWFQYIGQKGYYRDGVTGENLVRRRLLSAITGRWSSIDALLLHGESHPYLYASNDPVILFDPSGLLAVIAEHVKLSNGACGQFRWETNWAVSDCDQSGFIVQHMNISVVCRDCSNKVTRNEAHKYTEVWYVLHDPSKKGKDRCSIYAKFCEKGNRRQRDPLDVWCFDGCNRPRRNRLTCGQVQYEGEAYFVPKADFAFDGYSFAGYSWAGCLLSKSGFDDAAKAKKSGTAAKRTLTATWKCCERTVDESPNCTTTVSGTSPGNNEPLMEPPFKPSTSNRCESNPESYNCPNSLVPKVDCVKKGGCFGKKPDPDVLND